MSILLCSEIWLSNCLKNDVKKKKHTYSSEARSAVTYGEVKMSNMRLFADQILKIVN